MARTFIPTGITVNVGLGPCASRCRYCQLACYSELRADADRVGAIMDRLLDYRERRGLGDYRVYMWPGNSFNLPVTEYAKVMGIHQRCGGKLRVLLLGGLPHWADEELEPWLLERKALGTELISANFAGCGATHDYWNNMRGNFDFQMGALRMAASLGFELNTRGFLIRPALPQLERLLDCWEPLKARTTYRSLYPLFYSGLARGLEDERLTAADLDGLSERVKDLFEADGKKWKSERQWLDEVAAMPESPEQKGGLTLNLTNENIEKYEALGAEELLEDLTARTQAAYDRIPGPHELAARYGNPGNEKIYGGLWEVETLWMDRYLREYPSRFERELTHLGN